MKATILGTWEMNLPYIPREDPHREPWFLDWVLKAPTQAGKHLVCSQAALSSVLDVYAPEELWHTYEFFGGIGAQALMVEKLFRPEHHWVRDYHPDAVAHLRRVLPDYVGIRRQDAYDFAGMAYEGADLTVADFGDLTAFKAQASQKQGQLLAKIFSSNPQAVVMTDIAARYLHLHKKSYEPILGEGTCESYPQYLKALTDNLRARFGYALHAAYYTRWSCVMALVPADHRVAGSGRITEMFPTGAGLVLS